MKPSGQGKCWELLQDPTLVASTSLLLCSHRAGKPHGVSLRHGHSSSRAATEWLWGQEGTFLCSDSFGHVGGHRALRRGAWRCWGWAPKGGTPAVHPAAPPPCGSPSSVPAPWRRAGFYLRLLPSSLPPPAAFSSSLPSPQVSCCDLELVPGAGCGLLKGAVWAAGAPKAPS